MNTSLLESFRSQSPLGRWTCLFSLGSVWLSFLGLLAALYFYPNRIFFLFPTVLFLILFLYLFHEILQPQRSMRWELSAFVLIGLFLILLWDMLSKKQVFFIFANISSIIILLSMANEYFDHTRSEIALYRKRIGYVEKDMKSIGQENLFYEKQIPNFKQQIENQKKLSSFAREMGTLIDPDEIKQKLTQKLQSIFENEVVSLRTPSLEQNPIDHWVTEKRVSLLIKNTVSDQRFPLESQSQNPIKSIITTPLAIGKSLIGLIRVDSPTPNRFSGTDLHQIELYAHISTLTLENAQLFSKVNSMATQDGLTELATHHIFQEKLKEEILRAARYHTQLSLIMLDIDHFKNVNDLYGHLAGDQVLKAISKILKENCRPVDFAARYGGEEMVLILPENTLEQAVQTAEQIRSQIETHPIQTATQAIQVTASFGCSCFPQDAQSSNQLIRQADERLYRAKSSGRNQVIFQ